MRLTGTEAGFVDATPIKPGRLVDFLLLGKGLSDAVDVAEAFWVNHRAHPQRANLFAATVHALFLGQDTRRLQFERVMLLYAAIDACFAFCKSTTPSAGSIGHARRVEWMCQRFNMPVPAWADLSRPGGAELATIRNDAVHEALFMDAPLGFALHGVGTGQNLILEMKALICRLLVALIGEPHNDYVRSPVHTRQRHGLRLR